MKSIRTVLFLVLLVFAARAEEEPPAPASSLRAEYFVEDLNSDPGVVSLSGRTEISYGEFELTVPDGGVVIWVDPVKYRELRKSLMGQGDAADEPLAMEQVLGPVFRELYAEGDVTLRRGQEMVRASRLYYDFAADQAVIFDAEAVYRHRDRRRRMQVPLTVRAKVIRQLGKDRIQAGPARVTTCLYAEPHWEVTLDEILIGRDRDGMWAESEGNVLRAFDLPVFWFPWLHLGEDIGLEPIRSARIGRSSRFGPYVGVTLGTAIRFGDDETGKAWGEWRLTPVFREKRGIGSGLDILYGEDDYRGRLEAFYQRDRQEMDRVLDYRIPRDDRGRIRWQHRHVLAEDLWGGRLTGIAELSWLSDRGFLSEYYRAESLAGKDQEDVAYLDWAGGSHALSLTGKWRANEFQTQTEYRPRLAYDLFSLPLGHDLLGIGMDLRLSGEAEAAKMRRVYDHDLGVRGELTDRAIARGSLAAPFTVGPVRITPEFVAGLTDYGGGQGGDRADLAGSLTAATDFWRTWPEVTSEFFDLTGLRHIVDLSLRWGNRFAVTEPSRAFVVQDPADLLDEVHAFDFRIRNRLQTKRDGEVVDWMDLEVRTIFFPEQLSPRPAPFLAREEWVLGVPHLLLPEEEKWRSIRRKGLGPLQFDYRARLREDLFVGAGLWYDFETNRFETFSSALRYEAFPDLSFFLGHRAIRGDSSVVTAWADVRVSDRWGLRVFEQYDFRNDGGLSAGVTLRRHFHDFLFELTFRRNFQEDDVSFSISVLPALLFEAEGARDAARSLDFDEMRWYR